MTGQGGDILAWTENAIDRHAQVAQLATQGTWRTHDTHLGSLGGHTATILVDRWNETELLAWVPTMSHEPWDETRNAWRNAEHIVTNDPESVLRRCAADRKLIQLHGPWTDEERALIGEPASDESCKGCGFNNQEEPMVADYRDCPVLHAVAEGYGWTEGQA